MDVHRRVHRGWNLPRLRDCQQAERIVLANEIESAGLVRYSNCITLNDEKLPYETLWLIVTLLGACTLSSP